MCDGFFAKQSKNSGVDARIIYLDSSQISSALPTGQFVNNRYCTFSYYDTITVKKVDLESGNTSCNPLTSAYEAAELSVEKSDALSQLVFAFTDYSNICGDDCYTQEEINAFWSEKDQPVFFMTMINIGNKEEFPRVLKHIRELFQSEKHLSYLTFDHTDIILFSKGSSFKTYAKLLFSLNYKAGPKIEDTITFCSFSDAIRSFAGKKETFSTFLSFGVKDYQRAMAFCQELAEIPSKSRAKAYPYWSLGRNDVSVFRKDASLKWLVNVWDLVRKVSMLEKEPWYSTYNLKILIKPVDTPDENNKEPFDVSALKKSMQSSYESFEYAYKSVYNALKFSYDNVWLRWVRNSSRLAVELLGNSLSFELGVCIVPQFFDLFQYAEMLFRCKSLTEWESAESDQVSRDEERERKWEYLEFVQKSFTDFFSAMAVLIDSMNQTDRQFVQVPAFHLPSFTVPPKIAAFYTASAYRLVDLFHDDEDVCYSLMLSPKAVNNLSVLSHALQTILPSHQWLEIMISEPSFYTMRLTLETMGHEISHFSGQKSRCRNDRKDLMIECLIALYMDALISLIPEVTREFFPLGETGNKEIKTFSLSLKVLVDNASKLYISLKTAFGELLQNPELTRDRVVEIAQSVIEQLYSNPSFFRNLENALWEMGVAASETDYTAINHLEKHYESEWTELKRETEEAFTQRRELIKLRFGNVVQRIVRSFSFHDLQPQITDSGDQLSKKAIDYFEHIDKVSGYFSETFADLQMIMLFELDWKEYCALILRKDLELIHDGPLRVIAIAKALMAEGVWTNSSIKDAAESLSHYEELIAEDIFEKDYLYNENGINPILLYYLIEYLRKCVDAIKTRFDAPKNKEKIQRLRNVHEALSDGTSILLLQSKVRAFIFDFYEEYIFDRHVTT